jgi:S1-C subfamily serine protease
MKNGMLFLSFGLVLSFPLQAACAGPEDSVVRITASARYPNPVRPWAKSNPVEVFGSGVVIEGKRILTSAHLVVYAADLYVQSRPGEEKIEAKIEALGTDVDLAVLSVKDERFFQKRPALMRTSKMPAVQDSVVVYGFPIGGNDLSVTKGVVSRIGVGLTAGGSTGLMIQVSAAINPGNSGGPALVGSQMVGLVAARLVEGENIGYILANDEIETFLKAIRLGRYEGKLEDASGATYQRLENPALRRMLKVGEQVKGVLVRPTSRSAEDCPFQPLDIITRIGDYEINNEGVAQWENGLRVPFLWLASKVARDQKAPVTIWRNGRSMPVALPVTTKDLRLIREYDGERQPACKHRTRQDGENLGSQGQCPRAGSIILGLGINYGTTCDLKPRQSLCGESFRQSVASLGFA